MGCAIICCIAAIVIWLLLSLAVKIIRICRGKKYVPQYNSCRQVEQFNKELYPSGFAYDPAKDIFYSLKDAWQRKYGYQDVYDEMSTYFNMIIDREPVRFRYRGKYWMIEMWKGQYGLATGGEVGIYVSDDGKYYRCVSEEEEILMGITLIKDGKVIMQRCDRHWWLTAFKLGQYSKPEELQMFVELELYDREMCSAMIQALRKMGYREENFVYYYNVIKIRYDIPCSRQQKSRCTLTAYINTFINKHNCKLYQKYTKKYDCTLDKTGYIKLRLPAIYKACIKALRIWKRLND